jgi:hypothetical protein
MSTLPGPMKPHRPPAAIDVLAARVAARAYLWAVVGEYDDMADVVDALEDYAHKSGLVREIGQDAVQAIIAQEFEPYRRGGALA